MNKLSLVKYAHGEEKGLMHYVVFEKEVVVLSEEASKKVDYVKEKGKLKVSFDIKSNEYDELEVAVITKKDYVEKVYNYMLETNNSYFEDGFENLCVLRLLKK
jgi:hypothetical protein